MVLSLGMVLCSTTSWTSMILVDPSNTGYSMKFLSLERQTEILTPVLNFMQVTVYVLNEVLLTLT